MRNNEQDPKFLIINGVPPDSYEGHLMRLAFDPEYFEEHVKQVLNLLNEYAGHDPEKIEEFVNAWKRGEILRPKQNVEGNHERKG